MNVRNKSKLSKELKALYSLDMVNVHIYAIGLIALAIIAHKSGEH